MELAGVLTSPQRILNIWLSLQRTMRLIFVMVAPDDPLVLGMVDAMEKELFVHSDLVQMPL